MYFIILFFRFFPDFVWDAVVLLRAWFRFGDGDDAGSPRLHLPNAGVEELHSRGGGGREGRQQLLRTGGMVSCRQSRSGPVIHKEAASCARGYCSRSILLTKGILPPKMAVSSGAASLYRSAPPLPCALFREKRFWCCGVVVCVVMGDSAWSRAWV